jgi:muramoyltetrapeptide carboxypeptidase
MNEIRVIAPSDSWKIYRADAYERARLRFEDLGYQITCAENIKSVAYLGTASARLRAEDFNNAFKDTSVKAIIALHGGFSANEILPFIDWNVVKANPKPLIGYSDITVLVNAIFAMTGKTAYLGPNLGTIGHTELWEYSLNSLIQAINQTESYTLRPSQEYLDEETKHNSVAWVIAQEGTGYGKLIGGNIQSLFLLQGTEYQPNFGHEYILAIEDDSLAKEYTLHGLSRNLESILQLPNARQNLRGILVGRFEEASKVTEVDLLRVLQSKNLNGIPIVTNLDFGHTSPIATLPIGSNVRVNASADNITVTFNAA